MRIDVKNGYSGVQKDAYARAVSPAKQEALPQDDPAAVLFLSEEAITYTEDASARRDIHASAEEDETLQAALDRMKEKLSAGQMKQSSSLQSSHGPLIRRLVASRTAFEVQQIISEAGGELIKLRIAAASLTGDEAKAARAIIGKMERLISRGHKKIADLGKEDTMRRRQAKAEKDLQQELAQKIERELRQALRRRKTREAKYLRDAQDESGEKAEPSTQLDAQTQIQIAAQAQAMAAQMVAAQTATVAVEPTGAVAEGAGAAEADMAGAEGGEADMG